MGESRRRKGCKDKGEVVSGISIEGKGRERGGGRAGKNRQGRYIGGGEGRR